MSNADLSTKLDSLCKTVGDMMRVINLIKSKSEDQALLTNSMFSQVQLQGERLRQVEQVTTQVSESLAADVTTGMKQLTNDVTASVRELANNVKASAEKLTNDIDSKIEHFIKISTLAKDEMETKSSTPVDKLRESVDKGVDATGSVIKRKGNVKFDRKNTSQTAQTTSQQPSPDTPQLISRKMFTDAVDPLSVDIKALQETLEEQAERHEMFQRYMESRTDAIIDQMLVEAQVTRSIVTNTARRQPVRRQHTCDFHIRDFDDWVESGRAVYSRVWYLDASQTYVKGRAHFLSDKTVGIWLTFGSYPRVIGLESRNIGKIKVNVMVVRQGGKGDPWDLGNVTWKSKGEERIGDGVDGWRSVWGRQIASISCDDLMARGLVVRDKILLRFTINVV